MFSNIYLNQSQKESKKRLEVALFFYRIIAWRILSLTTLGRSCPELPCDGVFETEEWQAASLLSHRQPPPDTPPTINEMIRTTSTFGGFLNRKEEDEPDIQTLWMGLQRVKDFALAIQIHDGLIPKQR